jgi:dihydrofolate reductase
MAELFVHITVSLDGFIEDSEGDIEWMVTDTSLDALATDTLSSIDGMIFGRKSHALLASFWPGAAEQPDASEHLVEQARLMNALPKYVLTHGAETTGWANSIAISAEDVPRLKRDARRPLAAFAGARAVQSLLERGDVDELRIIRYPILIGSGTPLFADQGRRDLTLLGTESFASGAVLERYRFRRP